MKFTKNFKRVISLVCALAMVLSCMTVLFGMTVSAATVDVTLNNNGTVTNEALEAGAALPTPSSDIANNQFRGWYTDTTWTTKVETVPAEATTLYANWSTIKVTFDNWATYDSVSDDTRAELVGGAVRINFNQGNSKRNFIFPAYDVDTTTSYVFKEGKEYNITFDYKLVTALNHSAINRGLYYGYQVDGTATDSFNNTLIKQRHIFGAMNLMEEYETGTFTITAASTANIYLLLNNYSDTSVWFDNLYIEEVLPRTTVTLNNNGVITTEEIVEGGSLPTPTSDIEGNKFLGWYTDAQCTTAATEIVEGATYYAKWTTTVITFDNWTAVSSITDAGYGTVSGGVYTGHSHSGNSKRNYFVPAYEANNCGPYYFEEGKDYEITIVYKPSASKSGAGRKLYYAWGENTTNYQMRTNYLFTPAASDTFQTYTWTVSNVDIPDAITTATKGVMVFGQDGNTDAKIDFDTFIIKEIPKSYTVTMNNNGVVTTEKVLEGETYTLPTPTSDIAGNKFLGWYTDTTWATEVTEVTEAAAVYAKWSIIVVDFNNLTDVSSSQYGNMGRSVTDGVLSANLRTSNAFSIPAYDAAGAMPYIFVEGKEYNITIVYKSAVAGATLQYRYSTGYGTGGIRGSQAGSFANQTEDDVTTTYVTATRTITSNIPDGVFGADVTESYIGVGSTQSSGAAYIDKFIIEEVIETVKEGVIGTSIREESGAGETYKSAAIRFRGRVNAETIADAAKVGFTVVPDGYDVETYGCTAINKDTAAGTDITYVHETNVDGYVDYQVLVFGLTKENVEKDLCDLSLKVIFFYEDAEGVQHQIGEDYIKSFNDVANR